jgi:FHS family L-fucose permease-like MFS transporter
MKSAKGDFRLGMSIFGTLFFIFGFATTFIITLSAKVKEIFSLDETQAQLLTSTFFIAYPLFSLPSGYLIRKLGYTVTILIGLLLMGAGSFLFLPACSLYSFPLFLSSTLILAIGVVLLQTAANPHVAVLGTPETASGRLNLTQALNSLATMVAPWLVAVVIFEKSNAGQGHSMSADSLITPFVILGSVVCVVAVFIKILRLPEVKSKPKESSIFKKKIWRNPNLLLGALAFFFYVGAEVGNGSLLINYLKTLNLGGDYIKSQEAAMFAAIYWGGAMIGRLFAAIFLSNIVNQRKRVVYTLAVFVVAFFAGSFITGWNYTYGFYFFLISIVNFAVMHLGKGSTEKVLAIFAGVAVLLVIITALTDGNVALWAIVSVGFFNSVMFPNIFALAVKELDAAQMSVASGIINLLIIGGAILPLIMGAIADSFGYTWAFFVPALGYLYILFFALVSNRV